MSRSRAEEKLDLFREETLEKVPMPDRKDLIFGMSEEVHDKLDNVLRTPPGRLIQGEIQRAVLAVRMMENDGKWFKTAKKVASGKSTFQQDVYDRMSYDTYADHIFDKDELVDAFNHDAVLKKLPLVHDSHEQAMVKAYARAGENRITVDAISHQLGAHEPTPHVDTDKSRHEDHGKKDQSSALNIIYLCELEKTHDRKRASTKQVAALTALLIYCDIEDSLSGDASIKAQQILKTAKYVVARRKLDRKARKEVPEMKKSLLGTSLRFFLLRHDQLRKYLFSHSTQDVAKKWKSKNPHASQELASAIYILRTGFLKKIKDDPYEAERTRRLIEHMTEAYFQKKIEEVGSGTIDVDHVLAEFQEELAKTPAFLEAQKEEKKKKHGEHAAEKETGKRGLEAFGEGIGKVAAGVKKGYAEGGKAGKAVEDDAEKAAKAAAHHTPKH